MGSHRVGHDLSDLAAAALVKIFGISVEVTPMLCLGCQGTELTSLTLDHGNLIYISRFSLWYFVVFMFVVLFA